MGGRAAWRGPRRIGAVLTRLDHVAVAVSDLDAALARYERAFGLRPSRRERVDEQGVEEVMLPLGECFLQLLAATGEDTPVGRFLARRGEGLHHLAFAVDDIEAALARLKEQGVELVDEAPRRGGGGHRVAFIHPRATAGVLIELVERAEDG